MSKRNQSVLEAVCESFEYYRSNLSVREAVSHVAKVHKVSAEQVCQFVGLDLKYAMSAEGAQS